MKELVNLPFLNSSKNTITVFHSSDSDIRKKLATQMALEWATPFEPPILHVPFTSSSDFCQLIMKGLSNCIYSYQSIKFLDTSVYQTIIEVLEMTRLINHPIHMVSVLEQDSYTADVAKAFYDMKSLLSFGMNDTTICIICDKGEGHKGKILSCVDNWFDVNDVGGELVLTQLKYRNAKVSSNSFRLTVDASDDLKPYRVKP